MKNLKNIKRETSGVYAIVNIQTGELYVGSSKCIKRRVWGHMYHLNKDSHGNKHLQKAYNFDSAAFKVEVLEQCPIEDLLSREQIYLDKFHEISYNIATNSYGGNGGANKGKNLSEEHRRKIGEAHKGKKHSEETKKKIGEERKGKKHTEESKKKISESKKGKIVSEKAKRKMSEAGKKKVHQIDKKTKEIIRTHNSLNEAAEFVKRDLTSICNCLKGRQKTSGGYMWAYA